MARQFLNWDDVPGANSWLVSWWLEGGEPHDIEVPISHKPMDLMTLGRNPGEFVHFVICAVDANGNIGLPSAEIVWIVPLPAPQNLRIE